MEKIKGKTIATLKKQEKDVKHKVIDPGYDGLRIAIVEQAVEDYKRIDAIKDYHKREAEKRLLKRFFRSQWCYALCGIDSSIWETFIEKHDKSGH